MTQIRPKIRCDDDGGGGRDPERERMLDEEGRAFEKRDRHRGEQNGEPRGGLARGDARNRDVGDRTKKQEGDEIVQP